MANGPTNNAIREFVAWYCSEPRLAFNRTVVLRYRIHLEQRGYAPATINLRLAVVFFALQSLPRYDGRGWYGQPDPGVAKYMPTPAWLGSDCKGNELKPVDRRFRDGKTQEWNGERWRVVPFPEIADELRRDHPDGYGDLSDELVRKKMDAGFDGSASRGSWSSCLVQL